MTNDYFFPLIAIDELSNAAAVVVLVISDSKMEIRRQTGEINNWSKADENFQYNEFTS